ncbi:CsbD family protein [Streptomyces sp. ICN441]|nr:CsbD family protein [Streptomyces sp. ICN441]
MIEELTHMAAQGKKIRGKAQETVGKAKQKAGKVTGDEELRAEGTSDRVAGQSKEKAAEVEQTVRGTAEELKGKARKNM